MAEKGFGVKEINLIGASGTPTIESPNNLNLNAVNVAISTNATVGGTLTVSGNISIGGTLTYEDVTNIDSIGIVTARTGLKVLAGGANVVGVVTATTFTGSGANLTNLPAGQLTGTVADARISTLTASKLSGALPAISGANLTNLPAANITGTLPAISGANLTGIAVTEAPVTDYTVTANGSSAYRFHGGGVDETADDPDLYLVRGQKYRFNNTTGSSHPFAIREASGGSAYSNGVTGSQNGIQFFTVPYDAPAKIFYQCTVHSGMIGNIYIRGAGGQNTNVGITTFTGLIDVTQIKKSTGTLDFLAATHTFSNAAGSTEYLRIDSAGDLGLGVTPDNFGSFRTLHIKGPSNEGAAIRLQYHTDVVDSNDFIIYKHDAAAYLRVQGTDPLIAYLNGAERVRITSGGEFLVGATASSGARGIIQQNSSDTNPLDQGTSADSSGFRLQNYSFGVGRYTALSMECANSSAVQSASIIAQSVSSGQAPDIIIATRTSNSANTERLRITSAGRIGVVDSNPNSRITFGYDSNNSNNAFMEFRGPHNKSGEMLHKYIHNGSSASSNIVNILQIDSWQSSNSHIFGVVTVMGVSPTAAFGFQVRGYFYAERGSSNTNTTGTSTGSMAVLEGTGTGGSAQGSLSWSGNTLRYSTPSVAYLNMHLSLEYHTYDGATVSLDSSSRSF